MKLINLGLAAFPALLGLNNSTVIAQTATQQVAQANVLFVNPTNGNDTSGNGSVDAPYKTITKALVIAKPNNVIMLAIGTYNAASGEQFPLILKPGVSIQGNPHTRGRNIVIEGGGTFLSPTFARQDVTILGADRAGITGVTVTNHNLRGYGLWIESSSPVVIDNTFTGNDHDGISITGNSAPTIRSNYFYQNGANGMTIYGTSRPDVQENVFEQTGFGINIAQKAAPMLIGNRIIKNRSGVVTQANSRPILRRNVIEGNTEDGLVAIATSQPDLGTTTEPGGNVFRQNGRYDINGKASSKTISAFGNQLALRRTSGSVQLAGSQSPVEETSATTVADVPSSNSVLSRNLQNASADNEASPFSTPSNLARSDVKSIPNSTATTDEMTPRSAAEMTPVAIYVPPPSSTAQVPLTPNRPQQKLNVRQITPHPPNQNQHSTVSAYTQLPPSPPSTTAMTIPLPTTASNSLALPAVQTATSQQTLPVLQPAAILESELLPVPSANIPIGNPGKLRKAVVPENSSAPSAVNSSLPRASSSGLHYRVVVKADSESEEAKVRSLVPGAFHTSLKGRVIMQAGIFSDRANAEEMLQLLNSNGLRATIEPLD